MKDRPQKRKNLTNLTPQDLLLRWVGEADGNDVYEVHLALEYRQGIRPKALLEMEPDSTKATLRRMSGTIGRFQATGPNK